MRVCQFRHFGIEMRRQCTTGACDGKYLSILKGLLNVSNPGHRERAELEKSQAFESLEYLKHRSKSICLVVIVVVSGAIVF